MWSVGKEGKCGVLGKRENVECWERGKMWSVGKEGKCGVLGKRECKAMTLSRRTSYH